MSVKMMPIAFVEGVAAAMETVKQTRTIIMTTSCHFCLPSRLTSIPQKHCPIKAPAPMVQESHPINIMSVS